VSDPARDIAVIGNVNLDVLLSPVVDLPPPGVERLVASGEVRCGGAAANTALALAALGLSPRLIGCVGEDGVGRLLLEELGHAGVALGVRVATGTSTGVSVALEAPGRDRSFLTSLGSLASFDGSMIGSEALAASFVLLCGYFLLPSLRGRATAELLRRAHEGGATTLFDCGWDPEGWTERSRAEVLGLLPLVDVFLPNREEATRLTGTTDALEAARMLQAISHRWVVIKLGSAGCLAVGPNGAVLRADAPQVHVVDTTGAGDAFNAGLVCALVRRERWEEALRLATHVASAVISRPSLDRYRGLDQLV
jgi:sugar/nucleoside kinase (ribokinase family)